MNILILTTRNIYENSGEKTLMLSKDKELKKKSINLFYYSFRRKFTVDDNSFNVIQKQSIYDILYKKSLIKEQLGSFISKYNINIIVVSGNWILFLTNILKELKKEFNIKISYDYQGAIEEIKEYKLFKNNIVMSNILYYALYKYEKSLLEIIDGVEVVSLNCLKHLEKYYVKNKYKKVIIHCGIEFPIIYDDYKKYRKYWREYYALKDEEIVCVYAGGIAKWQNINEIINQANINKELKFFIYTSKRNQEKLKQEFNITDNIYFDFLSHEELQKALCAFDYGFLLRNEDITNYVAFPNKYSDYINARLRVIVKSNKIGCYPVDKEKQDIIINILDLNVLNKVRVKEQIYDNYIQELRYDVMINRLIDFYKIL